MTKATIICSQWETVDVYLSLLRTEADQILENEQNLLRLPGEPLNFEVIEAARKKSAKS